ncbi:hypothetical protein Desaci_2033 [Desulfosporosinus acidiphilus SJ4]|uniref:Ig-like domain-containing protein n=1 Tax=Desulfosporosinus acidiphilus (strain DSM 22704 / JCM 16185 / SJ4) TaxID=646529 RepID=I4D5D4_DESAJ|nr:hypothetical protein [Desulfosporosinus acidiphilus]AFM41008.1 hypothetical protein Desaci_2033 [Desulfosporosinus acidiphilus SJ4]
MVKLFDPDASSFNYMLEQMGKDLTLNDTTQIRAILSSIPVNANNHDDKYISTLSPLKQGDKVDYLLSKWLVVSQVNGQRIVKYKAIMRKCNYNVNFNFDGYVKNFPTFIEGKIFDVQSGQYIMLPVGKILVTLQENPDTLAIVINQRFISMNSPWKITGIDRTVKGLITLSCDLDLWGANDDKINEIADVVTYTVAFTDVSPVSVDIGSTYQTNISMAKDGASVTFPVTYSSDNGNVSVDANGLLTAYTEGTSIITVTKSDNPYVSATLEVTAKVNHVPVVVDQILPNVTSLLQTTSQDYTVYQYVDSVANSDTFTITASGPTTTYYTLTVSDGNHFTVYNKQYIATKLVITCTNNRDASQVQISIDLRGLW